MDITASYDKFCRIGEPRESWRTATTRELSPTSKSGIFRRWTARGKRQDDGT